MAEVAEVLRDRPEPQAPRELVAEPPGTPPAQPGFLDLATAMGENRQAIAEARAKRATAGEAERGAIQSRAATMAPAVQDVEQRITAPRPAPPTPPVIPPAPSQGLTPFLSPIAGEAPENTIGKLLAGIGLLAGGFTGLARGDATAALAGLSGAMKGWQAGDKERADRAFADWKAASDRILADWQMRHTTYRDIMEDGKLDIGQRLELVKLKAEQGNHEVAAAAAQTRDTDQFVNWLSDDRKNLWDMAQFSAQLEQQKSLKELEISISQQKRQEKTLMRSDIEAALAESGWRPEMPGYQSAYLNVAKQTGVEGLGVVGAAQLIVPPPPGGGAPGAPPAVQPQGQRTPPTPLVPATPKPGETTHYINKVTMQPPPANLGLPQIQASGEYVAVNPAQIPKFAQMRTAGAMLDSMEQIIRKRPDLWPENEKDILGARANYWALTNPISPKFNTDPDVGVVESNKVGIPSMVRSFGDVGAMSDKQEAIGTMAAGFGASTRAAALARIENIRNLLNQGLEPTGVTFRFKGTAPATPGGGGWKIEKVK